MGMHERQLTVTPRFDGVDVLRGFSILSVVLLHTWIRMHFPGSPVYHEMRGQLAHLLLRNGDNGVTVFFAVSGFLITLTSLRRFGSLGPDGYAGEGSMGRGRPPSALGAGGGRGGAGYGSCGGSRRLPSSG